MLNICLKLKLHLWLLFIGLIYNCFHWTYHTNWEWMKFCSKAHPWLKVSVSFVYQVLHMENPLDRGWLIMISCCNFNPPYLKNRPGMNFRKNKREFLIFFIKFLSSFSHTNVLILGVYWVPKTLRFSNMKYSYLICIHFNTNF